MKRPVALALSIAIHAAIAAVLLVRCAHAPLEPAGRPPQRDDGRSVFKVILLPSGEDNPSDNATDCPQTYRGIGITTNFGSNEVTTIAPGGPASRAGVLVGDVLLNPDDIGPDRFMVGYVVALHVLRDGRELVVSVRIGRICHRL